MSLYPRQKIDQTLKYNIKKISNNLLKFTILTLIDKFLLT